MAIKLKTANSTKAAAMPNRIFSPNRKPPVFISATPEEHESCRPPTPTRSWLHPAARGEPVGFRSYGIAKRSCRRHRQICGDVGNIRIGEVMCGDAHHAVRIIGAAAITPGVQLRNEIGIFLLPDNGKHGRRSATVIAMT